MSLAQRGENNHNFNKSFSEDTKRKMSENHADFSGENHPQWGKPKSEETRKKISESLGVS